MMSISSKPAAITPPYAPEIVGTLVTAWNDPPVTCTRRATSSEPDDLRCEGSDNGWLTFTRPAVTLLLELQNMLYFWIAMHNGHFFRPPLAVSDDAALA